MFIRFLAFLLPPIIAVQFFESVASSAINFVPGPLKQIAAPALKLAMAKANAKKGISDVFLEGEDYPWVCPCETFPAYPSQFPIGCPYDKQMGCTSIAQLDLTR
jgi:hypothetical protein